LTIHYSQIIPGIPFRCPDVLPDISPESQHHVNNNRRAQGQEGCVHKILSDLAGGDPQSVTDCSAYAKGVPFNEIFQAVHGIAKLEIFRQFKEYLIIHTGDFRTFAALFRLIVHV
jgi:hypothetical protein